MRLTPNDNFSLAWRFQACQHPQQGSLAATRRAKETNEFAVVNGKIECLEGFDLIVAEIITLGQLSNCNLGVGRRRFRRALEGTVTQKKDPWTSALREQERMVAMR